MKHRLLIAVTMLFCLQLTACEMLQTIGPRQQGSGPQSAPATPQQRSRVVQPQKNDDELLAQLAFIERLNRSSKTQIAAIHQRSKQAFEQSPSTENRLHLAWVWATPGHSHSNLWAAQKQLRELLQNHRLSQGMESLLRIRLADIGRNLQMQNKLAESDAKLRALTTLEHSLEERDAEVQEE